jgi:integrase
MSKLFSYAIAGDLLSANPCEGITRLYSGSRRDCVWSPAQIATFRSNAPAHLLLPFEIAIHTAQRQGDILAMTWGQYDGMHLTIKQSKGGSRVKVRAHYRLKAILDALPRDTMRVCNNSRGRPWTSDGFKTSWGKECARIGIEGVTFHDLRGTFVTERRREGATSSQIGLITGHSASEVDSILSRHYLAHDQEASDAVIIRMERNTRRTESRKTSVKR